MTGRRSGRVDAREEVPVGELEVTEGPSESESVEVEFADRQKLSTVPGHRWRRVHTCVGLTVVLVVALGGAVGYLTWQVHAADTTRTAAAQSVSAAADIVTAMLSYRPDTADHDLTAATDRMTGTFHDEYGSLVRDLVIPGAKQKQISAVATVPATALVSVSQKRAEVLVYIDQTTTIGGDPPTTTTSSAHVTLDKVADQWLIAQFEPI
jgi:Mce-associated membrane protein